MSRLDRWQTDHRSNRMSDTEARSLLALYAPVAPTPCRLCGYPGTFAGCCMVCQAIGEAIELMRQRPYWLRVVAEEQGNRRGWS